ncbi:MAG: RsmB/NOP family class I SAM-dependent RNA methyltransferase [Pseudomonadota bacterium]
MRAGGRVQAAIDILQAIAEQHRPAPQALADWGRQHRFAGSGDRAAIGNLVYDALRRRRSIAWRMGTDAPRALALGACGATFDLTVEEIDQLADGSQHAPAPLSEDEREGLRRPLDATTPDDVAADVPAWLLEPLQRVFGARLVEEGQALAQRATLDLRVNTLRATPEKVAKALHPLRVHAVPLAPHGLRVQPVRDSQRTPHVEAEPAHGKGWFEVQDAGSQVAAALSGAGPRMQVMDLCAGAGGKTLALAAMMQNTGQLHAYDADKQRFRPIFARLKRAGARNVQTLTPGAVDELEALQERMHCVLVDAPCSGSGVWRRRPDAKWRLKPQALADRIEEQRNVLTQAAKLVRPGGRLTYVTCSVLPEENVDQIAWFCAQHPDFTTLDYAQAWRDALGDEPPSSADGRHDTLLLTPASHRVDGFFIALLQRAQA